MISIKHKIPLIFSVIIFSEKYKFVQPIVIVTYEKLVARKVK